MILVVEDDFPIRTLLDQGLSEEGFRVNVAGNAEEALASIEREVPDAVLLDLMLPDVSGLELAAMIHERWPVTIVAMSASNALLAKANALPFVNSIIPKPFEWDILVGDLQRCVA